MSTKVIDVHTKKSHRDMSIDTFANHFQSLCGKYFIFPNTALENESIIDIFKNKELSKYEKLEKIDFILLNEF